MISAVSLIPVLYENRPGRNRNCPPAEQNALPEGNLADGESVSAAEWETEPAVQIRAVNTSVSLLLHFHKAVIFYRNGHPGLHVFQEFIAEIVYYGHDGV